MSDERLDRLESRVSKIESDSIKKGLNERVYVFRMRFIDLMLRENAKESFNYELDQLVDYIKKCGAQ